ncbi:UDP-2,3-diacylglucosamine hydrolase [Campylobacter majalis]|uniref:UDP-2,3-diacylglucosamine hydrolase n=1 Tax=Campylobacter majalis TaxID=2790656 RepID=A0ABN7KA02_9BACT|nr:UDP-2,3-diacylglucosamine diphosphatase [Campylobacter majalis]CAD7289280.1 UDP-2,3-diacylglucosamine hydrolase [Campylobacter majalis]
MLTDTIKDKAIFVSDAHVNENRAEFLTLLNDINSGKIATPQLFLMGDIFDFLVGYGEYCQNFYAQYIELINEISQKIQVYFIEGNHDFRVGKIFPNAKVYEISKQPVSFNIANKTLQIAHGDIFLPFVSKYALLFLRLIWFLKLMNFIDKMINFKISKWILNRLKYKKLDYKIKNFKDYIAPKLKHYDADIVIEGHYHQGKILNIKEKLYVNLPCFAFEQSYFIVECYENEIKFVKINQKGH